MRKDRPTRIDFSSPEWRSLYTVIFDTRMIRAISPAVRKLGISMLVVFIVNEDTPVNAVLEA
jgi:hypothetical protein